MEKREKVKQIYQKLGIGISEEYIDGIMHNKERLEGLMRMYKQEEVDSMNEIFKKSSDNALFSAEELDFAGHVDLFDRYEVKVASIIWKHRNNKKALNQLYEMLNSNKIDMFNETLNNLVKEEVYIYNEQQFRISKII